MAEAAKHDTRGYTDTTGAAAYLGVSKRTLEQWRWLGGGPAFVRLGRAVRYSYQDLDAYAEAGKRHSTAA